MCDWVLFGSRLDPSGMEAKKPYPNQPVLIHSQPDVGASAGNALHGPCALSANKTAHLQKPPNMIHNQPQIPNNRLWEPQKKKPQTNQNNLRFPSTKRPPEAAVAMQGWLHKQGSEGLKVWRKRWFVLSDYCLFYYKGPEEEKILGSILLPSYRVSMCPPDSKLGKKFAFKCEHTNMRTYYLAADSHEIMAEWVEALTMASILQSNSEVTPAIERQPVPTALYIQHHENNKYHTQPLYANAPPKPRRQNESGFSSPGYTTPPSALAYHPQPQFHYHPQHHHHPATGATIYQTYQSAHRPHAHCPPDGVPVPQNSERRTPDTYGRSKLRSGREASDYEDIYSQEEVMYKRPLSPIAYSNIKKISPVATIPIQQRPYALFTNPGPQIHPHQVRNRFVSKVTLLRRCSDIATS